MKILVAFISSFMMFVMTWLLVAVPLAVLVPYTQKQIVFRIYDHEYCQPGRFYSRRAGGHTDVSGFSEGKDREIV